MMDWEGSCLGGLLSHRKLQEAGLRLDTCCPLGGALLLSSSKILDKLLNLSEPQLPLL
jgi:hypothetical protein